METSKEKLYVVYVDTSLYFDTVETVKGKRRVKKTVFWRVMAIRPWKYLSLKSKQEGRGAFLSYISTQDFFKLKVCKGLYNSAVHEEQVDYLLLKMFIK